MQKLTLAVSDLQRYAAYGVPMAANEDCCLGPTLAEVCQNRGLQACLIGGYNDTVPLTALYYLLHDDNS